jgi:hypothetical protein
LLLLWVYKIFLEACCHTRLPHDNTILFLVLESTGSQNFGGKTPVLKTAMKIKLISLLSILFCIYFALVLGAAENGNIAATIGFQIHSWNDLREWDQAFKKGAVNRR